MFVHHYCYVSAYICIRIVVSWLYNILLQPFWVITKFSYSLFWVCFRCLLKNIKFVPYSFYILIAYNVKWGLVILWSLTCFYFLFLCRLRWILSEKILWLETTLSQEECATQFKVPFIHFLFMNIWSSFALEFFG